MSDTLPPPDSDAPQPASVFAYQQTKRLHLVIDQLLWSFDHLATIDQIAVCHFHLREMVAEAKTHVARLDRSPVRTSV